MSRVNAAGHPGDPIASFPRVGDRTPTAGLNKFERQYGVREPLYLTPNTDYFVVVEGTRAGTASAWL